MAEHAATDWSSNDPVNLRSTAATVTTMTPSPSQGTSQPPIFLDPTRTPREIRDLIYDTIIDTEYCNGKVIWGNDLSSTFAVHLRQSVWLLADYDGNKRAFLPMLAVCKQIREELLENFYRRTEFYSRIYQWRHEEVPVGFCHVFSLDKLTHLEQLFNPKSFYGWGQIRVLNLEIHLEAAFSVEHEAGENDFIKDPFSVRYTSNGSLPGAQLVRSDSSTISSRFSDLKQYGFYDDTQLPALLGATTDKCSFPTVQNSDSCKELWGFFRSLGAGGNLQELRMSLTLPYGYISLSSGMNDFMRTFAPLRGLKHVAVSVQIGTFESESGFMFKSQYSPSVAAERVEDLLRQDVQRVMKLMKSKRTGCNMDPNIVCNCDSCFPSLSSKCVGSGGLTMVQEPSDHDQVDVQERITEVEKEKKLFGKPRDEGQDYIQQPYWMDVYALQADCPRPYAHGDLLQIGQPQGYLSYRKLIEQRPDFKFSYFYDPYGWQDRVLHDPRLHSVPEHHTSWWS
ncbi:hypothetical protein IWZ00DRAFT_563158 [Phyllosticta capitalensis]